MTNPLTLITDLKAARATFVRLDEIINPVLVKAQVLQLSVNGQPVALDDCPLESRMLAFVGLLTQPESKQREAELVASNAIVAAEAETAKKALAVAMATIGGLQQDNAKLTTSDSTSKAAIATMTAEKAQLKVQLEAALSEISRATNRNLSINSLLSRKALFFGCATDLRDPQTKEVLLSTATTAEKEKAADLLKEEDKIEAICGSLNAAHVRAGVPIGQLPSAPAGGAPAAKSTDYNDPKLSVKERSELFRKAQAAKK